MQFNGLKLLVVGDLILDRYYHIHTIRPSQEADVPIAAVGDIHDQLGGAGGVATIATQLGAQVTLWAACGISSESIKCISLIRSEIDPGWYPSCVAEVSVKNRFVMDNKQAFCRFDVDCQSVGGSAIIGAVTRFDAVLIADYAKGFCTETLLHHIIACAMQRNIPVVADPGKGVPWSWYAGAIIKCNASEAAAHGLSRSNVIVTHGAEGMTLHAPSGTVHFSAEPCDVVDVTGAGDAVLAAIGCALAAKMPLPDACRLANQVARRCCGIWGARVGPPTPGASCR